METLTAMWTFCCCFVVVVVANVVVVVVVVVICTHFFKQPFCPGCSQNCVEIFLEDGMDHLLFYTCF